MDRAECEKYWAFERFDEKYYEIKETESETAQKWVQGKIDRRELIKELEAK